MKTFVYNPTRQVKTKPLFCETEVLSLWRCSQYKHVAIHMILILMLMPYSRAFENENDKFLLSQEAQKISAKVERNFSTSHVIPHYRALVPSPSSTYEVCVVAST